MKKGRKNLSNWQQNMFHMKCDAADSAEGVKGAPREVGKQNNAAEVPVRSWEDSGGGKAADIHLSKHSELWQPGHSHTGPLHSLTHGGIA